MLPKAVSPAAQSSRPRAALRDPVTINFVTSARDLSIAIERIVQVAWPRPLFNLSAAVESNVRSAIDPHQSFVLL